jgi:small redox-active disulfide protein 2
MEIKILGTGCPKCRRLEEIVREITKDIDPQPQITKVEDISDILSYGIINTPALVINEKVVLSGRIGSKDEIKEIILKHKN